MEFSLSEPQEAPPAMAANFVEEAEQQQHQARLDGLDPELYADAESTPGASATRGRFSPLTAQLTLGGVHRSLSYSGYERGPLTPYTLPFGATMGLGVDYYPGAHISDDALAHLGLHWRFEHSLGVGSTGPNEVSYPTTFFAFEVGARYRVPLDAAGSQVVVLADVGQHRFDVMRGSLENPAPEGLPEATYTQLRLGVSGRWALGDFGLGGRLAYTPVLDAGGLGVTFGGADGHGFEGALRVDYALPLGFAVLVEVDTRVYALGFSPEPTDSVIASGALDAYIGARLGVEWRMPAMRDL